MVAKTPLTSVCVDSNGETTSFSFRSSTTLHVGALKMPINIDKSVTVPALNQLKGFGLNSLQILLPAAASESQAPLAQSVCCNLSCHLYQGQRQRSNKY